MAANKDAHPCFSAKAKEQYGRIHLPVAPKCNVQCGFCSRKYDCVNESRPGVTSVVLSTQQAALYFVQMKDANPWLTVAGIAGPGDAFANPEKTLQTLELIREKDSEVLFCVSTNGLALAPYIQELKKLDVSHITVTVNAVAPGVGQKIYSWVRGDNERLHGLEGAEYLLERQKEGICKAAEAGMTVKINSIILPGINNLHIPMIAKTTAQWGASIHNCLPVIVTPESDLASTLKEPDRFMIHRVRKESEKHLPQMRHCGRCRADAIGLLGEENSKEVNGFLKEIERTKMETIKERPFIAAASMEGLFVNMHLGEALFFRIIDPENNNTVVEERGAPPKGGGDMRWNLVADVLSDCHTLLISGIGERPREILSKAGMKIHVVEGLINVLIAALRKEEDLAAFKKRVKQSCSGGTGCSGNAAGCM